MNQTKLEKLPDLPPVEVNNSTSINPKILKLIGGQEKWDEMCALYKEKKVLSKGRTPQLIPLFKEVGLTERTYNKVIGLIGDKEELHAALDAPLKLQLPALIALFNETVATLKNRLGEATTKEVIELLKIMPELFGIQKPTAQVNINNNTFDINKHLADRGIVIEDEDITSRR